jgi:hypothetical protein
MLRISSSSFQEAEIIYKTAPNYGRTVPRRGSASTTLTNPAQDARPLLQRPAVFLTVVVLAALALRLIVVGFVFRIVAAPTIDHNEFGWEMGWVARSIALGKGFSSPFLPFTGPTALVPPLYPYLLATIFKFFGIYSAKAAFVTLSLNSLFSALTCIPLYYSARHSLDTRGARLVAVGWAVYPFSVYFSADRVWDYALTALLFSLCFWGAQKLHLRGPAAWFVYGLLLGVCALSNPSICSVLPFLVLIAMWKVSRVDGPWFRNALLTTLAFLVVCGPWAARNNRVLHSHAIFRDGFWLEFYAGNHGDTTDSNPPDAHPASNPAEMKAYIDLGEIRYMEQKHVLAVDYITHHPGFFISVSIRRFIRFWTGFWSFSPQYLQAQPMDIPNLFFCTALTILMWRGIRRWWREDSASALPYIIAVVVFPFAYYITHSSMDYRQPLEPVILVLVIIGIFGTTARNDAHPGVLETENELPTQQTEPHALTV